ncbi:hypothetical protein IV203_001673 [Nitzschia inconspicua]|uniref:Uncharacterized protein n=1 Tax=Nitzschia inconspicua TaxID=303405 RepID=A0A9K3L8P0_9STRA|nr:hypothetical protein IV203_001673 [Nitzschia inconspicua]
MSLRFTSFDQFQQNDDYDNETLWRRRPPFRDKTGENKYAVIGAARLVLDGIDQCIVGRLGSMYDNVLDHLDGRFAQITEKFSDSRSQHKIDYNATNNGVCSAIIIDRYVPGDGVMNVLLDGVNLDSSDEEV